MLAKMQNIDLYRAFVDSETPAERCAREITMTARATTPLEAEITCGHAEWFLVHTYPGDDLRAMRWLARRRFGVFRPMQQRRSAHNEGQVVGVMEPVFPGWLFVYVFGMTMAQKSRILGVPGVMGILRDPTTQQPVAIRDSFVQDLRALSWVYSDRLGQARQARHIANINRPRRPTTREYKRLETLRKTSKRVGFEWDDETRASMMTLEPHARIKFIEACLLPFMTTRFAALREDCL